MKEWLVGIPAVPGVPGEAGSIREFGGGQWWLGQFANFGGQVQVAMGGLMARPFPKLLARFTLTFFSQNPFFFQVHSMSSMLSLVLHLLLQSTSVTSLQKIHTTVDNPSISLLSLHPPGHPAGGRSTLSSLPSLTYQPIIFPRQVSVFGGFKKLVMISS